MKYVSLLYILLTFSTCWSFARDPQEVFTIIYTNNLWLDPQSVSGPGSNLAQTNTISKEIPKLLKELKVKTLLDAPCGDFNWMQYVNLDVLTAYIGMDIVPNVINQNQIKYGNSQRTFVFGNIIADTLPQVDLILCRDCLVHFSIAQIFTTLKNLKKSKSKYLLTTTFTKPHENLNKDILVGYWRPLNLQAPPFNFPKPLLIINEQCPLSQYADKSLALWRIEDLPV